MQKILKWKAITFLTLVYLGWNSVPLKAGNPGYIHYTVNEGLPSNFVYQMYQDSEGYIWAATEYGLSRFDGYDFTNFTCIDGLSDNDIISIVEDSQGRIWFLTYNGLPSYYYKQTFYSAKNEPLLSGIKLQEFIKFLYEDAEGKISLFSNSNWHFTLDYQKSKLDTIHLPEVLGGHYCGKWQSPKGDDWLINSLKYKNETTGKAIDLDLTTIHYSRMYVAPSSNWIYVVYKEGIVRFDGEKKVIIANSDLLAAQDIIFLKEEEDGQIWIGTKAGAFQCRIQEDRLVIEQSFFEGFPITSVLHDNEEGYWFSTIRDGIFYVPSIMVNTFELPGKDKDAPVYSLYFDQESKQLFTGMGNNQVLIIQEEEKVQTIDLPLASEGLQRTKKIIKSNENRMMFINDGGLAFWSKNQVNTFKGINTSHVVFLENGDLFIKKPIASTSFRIPHQLTTANLIFGRAPSYEHEYIVSPESVGVIANTCFNIGDLNDEENKYIQSLAIDSMAQLIQLPVEVQSQIKEYVCSRDSSLWLVTNGWGLFRINKDTLIHFNESTGLSSNICKKVEIHGDTLWLATNAGVNKIIKTAENKYSVSVYDRTVGFPSNDVLDIEVAGDFLWVATAKGLSRMDIRGDLFLDWQVPLSFTNLMVEHKERLLTTEHRFKYWENDLKIGFVGLAYRHHRKLKYYYRLLGQNDEWFETTNSFLEFNGLAAGKYQLQIKASVDNTLPSTDPLCLDFQINPPFWQTLWFRLSFLALLLCFLFLIFKVRVLTYHQEALNGLVADMKVKLKKNESKFLFFKVNGQQIRIQLNRILWINGAGDYIEIITNDRKYLVKESLQNIIQKLDAQDFARIHRSYIIRIDKIEKINASKSVVINEQAIPIGKKYLSDFNELKEELVQETSKKE